MGRRDARVWGWPSLEWTSIRTEDGGTRAGGGSGDRSRHCNRTLDGSRMTPKVTCCGPTEIPHPRVGVHRNGARRRREEAHSRRGFRKRVDALLLQLLHLLLILSSSLCVLCEHLRNNEKQTFVYNDRKR